MAVGEGGGEPVQSGTVTAAAELRSAGQAGAAGPTCPFLDYGIRGAPYSFVDEPSFLLPKRKSPSILVADLN